MQLSIANTFSSCLGVAVTYENIFCVFIQALSLLKRMNRLKADAQVSVGVSSKTGLSGIPPLYSLLGE